MINYRLVCCLAFVRSATRSRVLLALVVPFLFFLSFFLSLLSLSFFFVLFHGSSKNTSGTLCLSTREERFLRWFFWSKHGLSVFNSFRKEGSLRNLHDTSFFFSLWYFVLILVIVNLKTDTKTKMRTMIQSYESLCCQYSKIFFF